MGEVIVFFLFAMVAFSGWGAFILIYIREHTYDGQVVITKDPNGKTIFSLELEIDPEEIKGMTNINFKVTDEKKSFWGGPIEDE